MSKQAIAKKIIKQMLDRLPFKRHLFTLLKPFKPPEAMYSRLRFQGIFRVRIDREHGFKMCSHGLGEENCLFWRGLFNSKEGQSLRLWVRLCRQARVVFDVGAYQGTYALAAKATNHGAQVYGFEPHRPMYDWFRANCDLNLFDIIPVRAAVGEEDRITTLYYDLNDSPTSSLRKREGRLCESVRMVTLENFMRKSNIERVDVMKIDVETFEPQVLEGLGEMLHETKPSMIVEVLNDEVGARLMALLGKEYLYFHIDEASGPSKKDTIKRLSRRSRNYFLCDQATALSLALID